MENPTKKQKAKIKALLETPKKKKLGRLGSFLTEDKWIKRDYARDQYGDYATPDSDEAVGWCFIGGMQRVFNYRYQEQRKMLADHIRENYPELIHVGKSKVVRTDEDVICRFNDNKKTKWADIQRVLMETGI